MVVYCGVDPQSVAICCESASFARCICQQYRHICCYESLMNVASAVVQVNLTGDMLISAGVVAYLGAFTASFRQQLVEKFIQLCTKEVRQTLPCGIDPITAHAVPGWLMKWCFFASLPIK